MKKPLSATTFTLRVPNLSHNLLCELLPMEHAKTLSNYVQRADAKRVKVVAVAQMRRIIKKTVNWRSVVWYVRCAVGFTEPRCANVCVCVLEGD